MNKTSIPIIFALTSLIILLIIDFGYYHSRNTQNINKSIPPVTSIQYEPVDSFESMDKQEQPYIIMDMIVTAYDPDEECCGEFADGYTSTGADAYTIGVAVDPTVIPYGTILDIPGYGVVEADDCGGKIKKNHIDVRFTTHQEALNWGVQHLKVKVYLKD